MGLKDNTLEDEHNDARHKLLSKFERKRVVNQLISFPIARTKNEVRDEELVIPNFVEVLKK